MLVWAFVKEFGEAMGKPIERISKKTVGMLQDYPWPGNVRELRNVIERAMILCTGTTLSIDPIESARPSRMGNRTLHEVERSHVLTVLESTGWRVYGNNGAAQALGLKPSTLQNRMKKLGIDRPR